MKIAQINPGLLPVPPNGWGAIEKIIWNYSKYLKKMGHDVDIIDISKANATDYDIVHSHVWNHCNELHYKNIPYIFTFHDHHAYVHGKNSIMYERNLLAMKNSITSIVPAKYLIEYFENIPIYLRHGVDLDFYKQYKRRDKNTKLLCVGNNGLAGKPEFDRKGFRYAIEAAEKLNMDITIVGPTNWNRTFFDSNPDLLKENVSVKYDLDDSELLEEYNDSHILLHATEIEAGHPPLTILEAAATGLPVITTDCNGDLYVKKCDRDTDSVISSINEIKNNYKENKTKTLDSIKQFDWAAVTKDLQMVYMDSMYWDMKKSILNTYKNAKKTIHLNKFSVNFVDGPFIEITGNENKKYDVSFIDLDSGECVYSVPLSTNSWARANFKRFLNIKIVAISTDGEYYEHIFDAKNKKVYIAFESSSLGDTLAWMPYVDEFRKKWDCKVVVSTFMNDLFEEKYPDIKFVKPGTVVHDLYAMYRLGIYDSDGKYDMYKHKTEPNKLPLQAVACDILGLEYEEIIPKIKTLEKINRNKPYCCIAIHSTSQTKYWNNPSGWQQTVDYLKSLGYDVLLLSKELDGHMGNPSPEGVIKISNKTIEEIGSILQGSELFIGLGSGLSWYSWSLGIPTILISGFSFKYQEMSNGINRVINETVCHGCFGRYVFDRGDWNWCPDHKGTERQFECTKSISFDTVKQEIDKIISNKRKTG